MNKKIGLITLAIVIIVVIVVVVVTRPDPEPPEPALTVYTLWTPEAERQAFETVLAEFQQQTGIQITHTPVDTDTMLVTFPTAFAAGTSPADVILAPFPAWILDLSAHLLPVGGLLDQAEFAAVHLDPVTEAGQLYAAPFKMAGKPGFWYKPSFFEAHNLTPPATYDQFLDLLADLDEIPGLDAAIASGNEVGWPLSDQVEGFIIGIGGYQLQLDLIEGTVAWTDDVVREDVFGPLVELLEAGYFSVPAEWGAQVEQLDAEVYGIMWMGDWIIGMVDDPDDIDFFPFPQTDGVVGAIDYAIIPEYTDWPDEARELVSFLASAEAQEIWAEIGGYLAPNAQVPLAIYPPAARSVAEFMLTVTVVPDLDDTIGGAFQTTFWDQLKLLWVSPDLVDDVLEAIQDDAPQPA